MDATVFIFLLTLCALHHVPAATSRIKITNNGYKDILIALPTKTPAQDRPRLISSLQGLIQESSSLLKEGTKGRAHFQSVVFLVPPSWGDIKSWHPKPKNVSYVEAASAYNREKADVVMTHESDHPYTLHQAGCGRTASRIYVPSSYILSNPQKETSKKLVQLWSEFRYGIFIEDGFDGDKMFPLSYNIPGDSENRTTGCNLDFFRSPNHWNSDGNVHFSGTHQGNGYTPKTDLFCEGPLTLGRNHNPEAPSKHNLLCGEQGTWYVVRGNADFKHGRNAARHESIPEVTFRFVKEVSAPKVVVAIEISSQMRHEDRYTLIQNAFSHFVITSLPDRSELSLVVFGGNDRPSWVTPSTLLEDEESRIEYLEGQPLPEEASEEHNVCLDCVLQEIIEYVKNESSPFSSAPEIVIVTTESKIDVWKTQELRKALEQSEIQLHVLSFADDPPEKSYETTSLYELCFETGNRFVTVKNDVLGDLYRAFAGVVRGPKSEVLITQEYLPTQDEDNIRLVFNLDSSLTESLTVSLSGATFKSPPLTYVSTTLTSSSGYMVHPKKQELVPSWIFKVRNIEVGEYVLETRRKEDKKEPVLLTVTSSAREDSITAKVWVEIMESEVNPPPVQIFAEVKQGQYPIRNASVVAYAHHPGIDGVSETWLSDDGLGNVDITEGDGIYSSIYTNFTTTGFYNVYIKVTGGSNTEVLKGPPSACCGSTFSYRESSTAGQFQREAGPATFQVQTLPNEDIYPPSKVMDLRIFQSYDKIVVVHWTAVGDDFNEGVATSYELKLFPDRFTLRNRFSDSGLEVFSEKIDTTPLATYGTNLYHMLQLPTVVQGGVYYFGIRAVDEAGNAGEPSNAVPVWIDQKPREIVCSDDDE